MKIEIVFHDSRFTEGARTQYADVRTLPRIGECLSIDGDDVWQVQGVIHFITPIYINNKTCVVAQVRVG